MENKKYFYGNEVSEYGVKSGYVDYRTLAKCFEAVLCNNVWNKFGDEAEPVNGSEFYEDEDGNEVFREVYQWYIISDNGAEILQRETDEILYYIPSLDVYVWGVTHYGTAWDMVITNIRIDW